MHAKHIARPIGRDQTKARIALVSLGVGIGLDQPRSVLRRIRVVSKAELMQRILAYLDNINREPVIHTWSYKITLPA